MNKDDLASAVAAAVGLSQADAKRAVEAVFDGVTGGMKDGVKVSVAGFGTFESRYRAARPVSYTHLTLPTSVLV